MTRFGTIGAALLLVLAGAARADDAAQCPAEAPAAAQCRAGTDANGAPWLTVIPERWNGVLVVHARDGPATRAPTMQEVVDSFARWHVLVQAGYAWAGTGYRRASYDVGMAVGDLESVRGLFIARFGTPRRIVVHGQGWGGDVAARALELRPADFDGALLTNGELAGGTRGEDYRMDLRVVYEFYCRNHPRPDETAYPLWMGLPPGTAMNGAQVRERLNACTGSNRPADRRSASQRAALAGILAASGIPERTLATHLTRATVVFAELVNGRLGGRNPFSTEGVRYGAAGGDRALDAGVARYRPDPAAFAALAADSDPTGRVEAPVLTLHAIGDPVAYVEHEAAYRATFDRAGTSDKLVQVFTDEAEHRHLSSPEYLAALDALVGWIERGRAPAPADVDHACRELLPRFDAEACRVNVGYRPRAWEARVPPRTR